MFLKKICIVFLLSGGSNVLQSSIADSVPVVVLGHITGGMQVGSAVSASLQVDKVLKGSVAPGQVLPLVGTAQNVRTNRPLAGSGIWFLAPVSGAVKSFSILASETSET